jgi:hypothetical protein
VRNQHNTRIKCIGRKRTFANTILFSPTPFPHWGNDNAEAREEFYERARAAQKAEFDKLDPPPSELDVVEERFKLNLAIHGFEFSNATGLDYAKF